MEETAVVVGATGHTGPAVVRAPAEDGWRVRAVSRTGRDAGFDAKWGVETVRADRDDDARLRAAVTGADVLVDVIASTGHHGGQRRSLAGLVGSAVVAFTSAVHTDDRGRGFATTMSPEGLGVFPEPIAETQPAHHPAGFSFFDYEAEDRWLAAHHRG